MLTIEIFRNQLHCVPIYNHLSSKNAYGPYLMYKRQLEPSWLSWVRTITVVYKSILKNVGCYFDTWSLSTLL